SPPINIAEHSPATPLFHRNTVILLLIRVVMFVWIAGILFFTIRFLRDEFRFFKKRRDWKFAESPELLRLVAECRKQCGLRQKVMVFIAQEPIGAASCGIFYPSIVLSQELTESFDSEELRFILLHEMLHHRHLDPLTHFLSQIVFVLHWLNPFVWILLNRFRLERELAVDESVVRLTGQENAPSYGNVVLKVFRQYATIVSNNFIPLPALLGVQNGSRSQDQLLERRITMILKSHPNTLFRVLFGMLFVTGLILTGLTDAQTVTNSKINGKPAAESVSENAAEQVVNVAAEKSETSSKNTLATIRGHVTDQDGKPIEGALLIWGTEPNDYWDNREKAVQTNKDGYYESPELKTMTGSITVIAEGFAPDMLQTEFKKGIQTLDFSLKKGNTLEIHFVDSDGKPVPNVRLTMGGNPDSWWRTNSNIHTGYFGHAKIIDTKIPCQSDENGIYRWTWAPEDKVRFNFSKEGYMTILTDAHLTRPYDWLIAREQPYQIVMHKMIIASGKVLDDETGQSIANAKMIPGNIVPNNHPDRVVWQTSQYKQSNNDGTFTLPFPFFYSDSNSYRLKADADGYESFVSDELKLDNPNPVFEIRLKKTNGFSGTVFLSDGSPAANAKIYVADEGQYIQVSNPPESVLLADYMGRLTTTAGKDGKFTIFKKADDHFGIYLDHPQGIAWVKNSDFLKNREIRLRGFAKLEMNLPSWIVDGGEGHVTLSCLDMSYGFGHVDYQQELKNSKKNFVFENVAAGTYNLSVWKKNPVHQWIRGSAGKPIFATQIKVEEGKSQKLDIELSGIKVTGKIKLPDSVEENFTERDWNYNYVELSPGQPQQISVYMTKSEKEPQTGIFQFESLPPGQYTVFVVLSKAPKDTTTMDSDISNKPIDMFSTNFVVEINRTTPLDLGTIPIIQPTK
ncbi:MAG: carboxypeptidase regulatory-like domain-containing protein, partial [Planctomycetaceae bacterium]|nr:carboxypeptidase regulatory-like domain-containing protein [Planctomycetaceae bacterium]